MRVLTIITPSRLGGAERYCGWLCKWERENGHEALLAVKNVPGVVAFYGTLGLDVQIAAISGKLNPFAVSRIRQLVREFKPDIVHTHLSTASLWGSIAAGKEHVASVAHVHSLNKKAAFRFADKIIAVSAAVKKHLVNQGLDSSRIHVVWPAEPVPRATPAQDIKAVGGDIVACASHLREEKGLFVLLEAVRLAIGTVPGLQLVLAGEGPDKSRLAERAKRLGIEGRVHFLGFRSDVPAIFASSKVAVLPSLSVEGFPLVIWEANISGIPVVASKVGGVSEAIDDRVTGLLVDPKNPKALAEALEVLLTNEPLRLALAENAKKKSEQWTMGKSAAGCLQVFEEAINLQKS